MEDDFSAAFRRAQSVIFIERMSRLLLLASILGGMLALACVESDREDGGLPTRLVCAQRYATTPIDIGILGERLLVETSGVVASLWHDDLLWMHNDSGDAARVYAIGGDASLKGRVRLSEASVVDVEDIAVGLCPERRTSCLFVADTGDNHRNRLDAAIFIVEEPAPEDLSPDIVFFTDRYIRVPLTFEGGPVNVEAVVVHPEGAALLLIEKIDDDGARVFEARGPFQDGRSVFAKELFLMPRVGVGMVENGRMITGADLHLSGTRLAVRTYTGVYELQIDEGQPWSAFASVEAKLVALGPFSEPQGEAIAYTGSGDALVTVSEDPARKQPQMLHQYPCERGESER
jgi:hypothetical protein